MFMCVSKKADSLCVSHSRILRCIHPADSNDTEELLSENGTEASEDAPVA